MTADTTPRNGRAKSSEFGGQFRQTLPYAVPTKIGPDNTGPFGRTVDSVEPKSSLTPRERVDLVGVWLNRGCGWIKDFFDLPNPLTRPPAEWAELTAYAHHSARMQMAPKMIRILCSIWLYVVALPVVGVGRWREWILTRPGRAISFLVITTLFLRFTPVGHWLADHLIRPYFHVLAWIFLP